GGGGRGGAERGGVRGATGEILVFSEVTTVYPPETIRAMVENFAAPAVGCVGGDLHYEKDPHNPSAQGRALFWGYERQLRIWESQVHSIVGVAGGGLPLPPPPPPPPPPRARRHLRQPR